MFCKSCGIKIEDDSRFCRSCGAAQESHQKAEGASEASSPSEIFEDTSSNERKVWTMLGGILVAVLVIAFVISLGGNERDASGEATSNVAVENASEAAEAALAAADVDGGNSTPPTDAWTYRTSEDKVRGGTTYFASTTSTNSIAQGAPYDANTTMDMTIRKSSAYGTDVVLTISSGQMMCPSYEGCSGTVRFDDHPAQQVSFAGPADNSSDTIFVEGAASFIGKLKKAKKVIIEKTLYEAGNPQFEFNVSDLKWEH